MPPKRRAPNAQATTKPKGRQSALAKEHGITASTEAEIKECYNLFCTSKDDLPTSSLKRALAALDVPPSSNSEYKELISVADPEDEGSITYANFVGIAALKLNARGEEDERREAREGFELFCRMGGELGGEGAKITIDGLRRIAGLLKEDVKEDVLRDMMLEANGGAGIGKGVDFDEFQAVMIRAGCFR